MSADTISLGGQVAIVTGSGRENGIGAAIAMALARNGAAVAINYISESSHPRAEAVVKKLEAVGARATSVRADISTPEGATELVHATLRAFETEKIDILGKQLDYQVLFCQLLMDDIVNNAGKGVGHGKLVMELVQEELQEAFSTNVFGTIYMTQAAVPRMPRGSCIVNIGTNLTQTILRGVTAYAASKAAQDFVSSALALELGKSNGIRVNTVAPGGVMTDAASWFPEGELRNEGGSRLTHTLLLEERPGYPEEIADAVLMFVSPLARWVTGQYILASGGDR